MIRKRIADGVFDDVIRREAAAPKGVPASPPYTLNPKPQTLNPKPQPLNVTLHPKVCRVLQRSLSSRRARKGWVSCTPTTTLKRYCPRPCTTQP